MNKVINFVDVDVDGDDSQILIYIANHHLISNEEMTIIYTRTNLV